MRDAPRPSRRTPDPETLLRAYRAGDTAARDELVEQLLPFARRLAARYRNRSEEQDDLEQVAYVGLLKAIERADPDRGPLLRFAVPTILGELKRHFRDHGWTLRVPRTLQENFLVVGDAVDELTTTLGRSPRPVDIAEATGLPIEQVVEALAAASAYSPTALDAPRRGGEDDDGALGDSLGRVDAGYELVEVAGSIGPALAELPSREREILRLRFEEDLTQSEIAQRIGISQMHVSRLLRRALDSLGEATAA
jgi:RNA polymerase sigma-B factor